MQLPPTLPAPDFARRLVAPGILVFVAQVLSPFPIVVCVLLLPRAPWQLYTGILALAVVSGSVFRAQMRARLRHRYVEQRPPCAICGFACTTPVCPECGEDCDEARNRETWRRLINKV